MLGFRRGDLFADRAKAFRRRRRRRAIRDCAIDRLEHLAFVLLERITMRFSHHNFSQSPEDMSVAVDEHISRADRLELIGNGIDIRAFAPELQSAEKRAATRRSLGLGEDNLVIGMVARLVAE